MIQKRRRTSRRRVSVVVAPITIILIIAVSLFGIGMFFRITEVEIRGEFERYTQEEIAAASGAEIGDSLFFARKAAIADNIKSSMTYMRDVEINKKYPGKLVITVDESVVSARLRAGDKYWMVDSDLRALEELDAGQAAKYILIKGITTASAELGQRVVVDESEETRLKYASDVLSALEELDLISETESIDLTNPGAVTLSCMSRFTVELGSGENAYNKLKRIPGIISSLGETAAGTIDVSGDGESYYIPC